MIRRLLIVVMIMAVATITAPALAHTRSESHTDWTITGSTVQVEVTLPDLEAKRLGQDGQLPSGKTFIDYFSKHLGADISGKPCPMTVPPRMIVTNPGYMRAEFRYACPTRKGLNLYFSGLFELISSHVDFAEIQLPNGDFVEQLFTKDSQSINADAASGNQFHDAGVLQFIGMGIMHIFTGVDHMSFLLGLILLSRSLKDLLFVVTGFTIGHSLTLALAVTGVIRPHAEFIDALIALTIALVGIESIALTQKRPNGVALAAGGLLLIMGLLRLMGIGLLPPALLFGAALFSTCYLIISKVVHGEVRIHIAITLIFGLVHGFGFASDLLKDRLPAKKLMEILVGFNSGVEVGQITVVLAILGFVAILRKLKLTLPRPITVDLVASGLVGVGVFWFISRSFAV